MVSALENLSETELTLEKVKSRLLEEELKQKFKKGESASGAEQAAAFNAKDQKPKKIRFKPKCYRCGEIGHKKPNCPTTSESAQSVEKSNEKDAVDMICEMVTGTETTATTVKNAERQVNRLGDVEGTGGYV